MLTQRTIARFQRFLSGLMQYEFYGIEGRGVALPPANYYNRLYEDGIPRPLLDVLGNRTGFQPVRMTLALFEGQAVAEAIGASRITDTHCELGMTYLLCFMAVAVRFYEQLPWEKQSLFEPDVREFIESLRIDGFAYQGGVIREIESGDAIVPVPLDGKPPRAIALAKPTAPKPAPPEPPPPEPEVEEATAPIASSEGALTRALSNGWVQGLGVASIAALVAFVVALWTHTGVKVAETTFVAFLTITAVVFLIAVARYWDSRW